MELHDNKTGEELAEAERRLRERLDSLNIEQPRRKASDFWFFVAPPLIASIITIAALCVIYLIYLGALQ